MIGSNDRNYIIHCCNRIINGICIISYDNIRVEVMKYFLKIRLHYSAFTFFIPFMKSTLTKSTNKFPDYFIAGRDFSSYYRFVHIIDRMVRNQ